ncbi:hypothetical protein Pelo_12457 [Pelomyxa schiedti]|nr:hypothetical protein Pelo_12457 [Pelomyxa schiedti]
MSQHEPIEMRVEEQQLPFTKLITGVAAETSATDVFAWLKGNGYSVANVSRGVRHGGSATFLVKFLSADDANKASARDDLSFRGVRVWLSPPWVAVYQQTPTSPPELHNAAAESTNKCLLGLPQQRKSPNNSQSKKKQRKKKQKGLIQELKNFLEKQVANVSIRVIPVKGDLYVNCKTINKKKKRACLPRQLQWKGHTLYIRKLGHWAMFPVDTYDGLPTNSSKKHASVPEEPSLVKAVTTPSKSKKLDEHAVNKEPATAKTTTAPPANTVTTPRKTKKNASYASAAAATEEGPNTAEEARSPAPKRRRSICGPIDTAAAQPGNEAKAEEEEEHATSGCGCAKLRCKRGRCGCLSASRGCTGVCLCVDCANPHGTRPLPE